VPYTLKLMKKRGQLQISFGMIFSIIIIIALVATAFYVITYFLNLSKCTQILSFYQNLDDRVKRAWAADIVQETFSGNLPRGIESVCLGNLTQDFGDYETERQSFSRFYRNSENNIFLFPTEEACGKEGGSFNLKKARADSFFCLPVSDGKASIQLAKGSLDALVRLESP